MAFEIFDDVAFYFVCVCLFALLLLPPTLWMLATYVYRKLKPAPIKSSTHIACTCELCVHKQAVLTATDGRGPRPSTRGGESAAELKVRAARAAKAGTVSGRSFWERVTWKQLAFAGAWLVFLYLVVQLPNMQNQGLATFDPAAMLGVAVDATEQEITRAWRKKSLVLHPDKNRDDPDAEQKFILLTKAYQMLTDPATKENMAKFGNPDGFKGVSVTIGLPSWLTKRENELPVLFLYFLLLIVLPPVLVFMWWRKAKNYHDSGAMNESLALYFKFITENMSVKYLVEILAASAEYRVLGERPTNPEDFKKLLVAVKDGQVKPKFNMPYIIKANTLLHAHLMRVPIPASMVDDLHIILKDAHRLTNIMFGVCMAKRWLRPSLAIIDLQQLLTQSLWVHESPLLQLPYFTEKDVAAAGKKGLRSISALKQAAADKKRKILTHFTEEEWKNIDVVTDMMPAVSLDAKCEVEDEEGVYEHDVVCMTVTLSRVGAGEIKESEQSSISMEGDEDQVDSSGGARAARERLERERAIDYERQLQSEREDKRKRKDAGMGLLEDAKDEKGEEKAVRKARADDGLTEEQRIEQLIISKPKKPTPADDETSPVVHCNRFPWVKREKWTILVVEQTPRGPSVILDLRQQPYHQCPNLVTSDEAKFYFRAPAAGITTYELHAKCDSYIGCDQMTTFKLKVERIAKPKPIREFEAEDSEDEEEEEMKHDDEEEEQAPGKWYYLGLSSFWELVLNAVVLIVLGFLAYQFLHSRGWWQKFVQPVVDVAAKVVGPPASAVYNVIRPVADPVVGVVAAVGAWLSAKLHSPVDMNSPRFEGKKKARGKADDDDY